MPGPFPKQQEAELSVVSLAENTPTGKGEFIEVAFAAD